MCVSVSLSVSLSLLFVTLLLCLWFYLSFCTFLFHLVFECPSIYVTGFVGSTQKSELPIIRRSSLNISCFHEVIKEISMKNSEGCDIIPQRILIEGIDVLIEPLVILFDKIYWLTIFTHRRSWTHITNSILRF